MKGKHASQPRTDEAKIIALPRKQRLGRIPRPENATAGNQRSRFRILKFLNDSGSISWRVQGMDRQGKYIRQNFADLREAQCQQVALEAEYHRRQPDDPTVRATRLTEAQLRLAETAFARLECDEDVIRATDWWLRGGKAQAVVNSPRLDQAVQQFDAWLADPSTPLRPRTKGNLHTRIRIFGNSAPNLPVNEFTPEIIETYLQQRKVSLSSKDNDKRAVARFFSWCCERPRRWTAMNPCREVRIKLGERPPPPSSPSTSANDSFVAPKLTKTGRWSHLSSSP